MELFYRTFGQGSPIIILHGLFGFSDNWQTIAKALADNFTVITPDLRNHGKSSHAPTHSYSDLSHDLYEFLTSQWIFESILIGHSMGGKAAMQFALDHPDMVSKLVVIDIAPGQSKTRQDDVFEALNSIDLHNLTDRKLVEQHLMEKLGDIGVVQFLLKNLTRNTDGALEWKMNLSVLTAAHDEVLKPIQGDRFLHKTLFIRGERSKYIQDADLPEIKAHFPNSEVHTIHNAGHWVHADQPLAVIEALRQFLLP
jgi:esterase